jgi:hypothetical protein|tara:strand:+ start:748 stop:921 length:174 start_codon:yes stop_codon:yes gene_type:complete
MSDERKELIQEINRRLELSLDNLRTEKSRWHHRQIARLKLRELKKFLTQEKAQPEGS